MNKPLDYSDQKWIGLGDKFPRKIQNATSTSDGLMSAEDKAKLDSMEADNHTNLYDIATWESDGLMAKDDKKKLDGIETNANNYIHPNSPEIRHVTDEQISYWNAKASTNVVTHTTNGLMIASDKIKIDNIPADAKFTDTVYTHPDTHPASIIVQDTTHRFVTDAQIESWDNKAEVTVSSPYTDGLMSKEDKAKLDSIQSNANHYVHPNNEGIRHVTDAEKEYWNSKASKAIVTNSENGLMAYKDKIKLDGIEPNANYYVHPSDKNTRHVTDEQIMYWDSKSSTDIATPTENGLMSKEDKRILDSLAAIDPLMEDKHFVTSEEKEKWNVLSDDTFANLQLVTHENDGIMSKEDKKKLDQLIVPLSYELRLIYSEWSETAPYTQVLHVPGIEPSANAYIGINANATVDQMECAALAKLSVKEVRKHEIEIMASGVRPTMDIPVAIMAGSSILIINVDQYVNEVNYSDSIPTEGYHYQNEVLHSKTPVQSGCIGWVCIESGTPGTWIEFGSLTGDKTLVTRVKEIEARLDNAVFIEDITNIE